MMPIQPKLDEGESETEVSGSEASVRMRARLSAAILGAPKKVSLKDGKL